MLGMMNSPTEGVDFYCAAPRAASQLAVDSEVKVFSEVKEKPVISYTEGGVTSMWGDLLLRSAVKQNIPVEEEKEESVEGKKRDVDKVRIVEPVEVFDVDDEDEEEEKLQEKSKSPCAAKSQQQKGKN